VSAKSCDRSATVCRAANCLTSVETVLGLVGGSAAILSTEALVLYYWPLCTDTERERQGICSSLGVDAREHGRHGGSMWTRPCGVTGRGASGRSSSAASAPAHMRAARCGRFAAADRGPENGAQRARGLRPVCRRPFLADIQLPRATVLNLGRRHI